jgi:hypothetical protein
VRVHLSTTTSCSHTCLCVTSLETKYQFNRLSSCCSRSHHERPNLTTPLPSDPPSIDPLFFSNSSIQTHPRHPPTSASRPPLYRPTPAPLVLNMNKSCCWFVLLLHLTIVQAFTPLLPSFHPSRSSAVSKPSRPTVSFFRPITFRPTSLKSACEILGELPELTDLPADEADRYKTLLDISQKSVTPSASSSDPQANDQSPGAKIINILPEAIFQLKFLQMKNAMTAKKKGEDPNVTTVLRMSVKRGGCSGLSYDMVSSDAKNRRGWMTTSWSERLTPSLLPALLRFVSILLLPRNL